MAKPGPQKVNRCDIDFELLAGLMSEQPGVLVQHVADWLCIRPNPASVRQSECAAACPEQHKEQRAHPTSPLLDCGHVSTANVWFEPEGHANVSVSFLAGRLWGRTRVYRLRKIGSKWQVVGHELHTVNQPGEASARAAQRTHCMRAEALSPCECDATTSPLAMTRMPLVPRHCLSCSVIRSCPSTAALQ